VEKPERNGQWSIPNIPYTIVPVWNWQIFERICCIYVAFVIFQKYLLARLIWLAIKKIGPEKFETIGIKFDPNRFNRAQIDSSNIPLQIISPQTNRIDSVQLALEEAMAQIKTASYVEEFKSHSRRDGPRAHQRVVIDGTSKRTDVDRTVTGSWATRAEDQFEEGSVVDSTI
jgi:hypothetical protein